MICRSMKEREERGFLALTGWLATVGGEGNNGAGDTTGVALSSTVTLK
jgi:hypothetical protein